MSTFLGEPPPTASELLKNLYSSNCFSKMVAIRRDLHQHPELSWQETRTAQKVCQRLQELNIPYRNQIAKTGIIAELPGEKAGPFLAFRADMDALPIQEETGLEFSSSCEGVMHACAHDGHTSILLGAAELLSQEKKLPLPVRLIFQPAEEMGEGAKAMVEAGALENVLAIFGGHIDRHYQCGEIAISNGAVNASTDTFEISILGEGGHAARPHESVDAVVVGSLIVMAIQTIVSREVDPSYPSVVSVSTFHAGTASNVIAGNAQLSGTIRAQHAKVREHLKNAIYRVCKSIGELHNARIQTKFIEGTPAVLNHAKITPLARQAAGHVVGSHRVTKLRTANMGGEDFGYYLEQIPGCYVRFGAQVKGKEGYPAHSSKFDFDENVLAVGASYYHSLATKLAPVIEQQLAAK